MRYQSGTATVGSSAVQISGGSTNQRVRVITFKADEDNTGIVRLGRSDVTSLVGFGLRAGAAKVIEFDEPQGPGSESFDALYIHGTVASDTVDWDVVLDG